MKRLSLLLGIVLLMTASLAFSETAVLIDFSRLEPDAALGGRTEPNENEATLVDFSAVAGASYDDATKKLMKSSLAVNNWQVVLASSARTVSNMAQSMARVARTSANAKPFDGKPMANTPMMGIRVHFPQTASNSYAIVKPPFEIPAYAIKTELRGDELVEVPGDVGTKFDGYGVVRNVGVLKSVSATVYGSNHPNGFGIILKNQDGEEQTIFLDYLQFDGWRKLVWNNPNYIAEVRNRELKQYPMYPKSEPFVKLEGLVFYKDAVQDGGDLITYIKDIELTYDLAVLEPARDFDHESIWGILGARQEARQKAELKRLGNLQVLRYLEQQKMHQEEQQ